MMVKHLISLLILLFLLAPLPASAAKWSGNVNGFIGSKVLDEDEWEPLDEHGELGIRFDFAPTKNFPLNFAIDLYGSGTSESYVDTRFGWGGGGQFVDVDAVTSEFSIGFRKYMPIPKIGLSPFVGAGFVSIAAEIEAYDGLVTYQDDDSDGGLWLEGGAVWTFKHANVGFVIRYSDAEVELFGQDLEVGGGHAGIIGGFHW